MPGDENQSDHKTTDLTPESAILLIGAFGVYFCGNAMLIGDEYTSHMFVMGVGMIMASVFGYPLLLKGKKRRAD